MKKNSIRSMPATNLQVGVGGLWVIDTNIVAFSYTQETRAFAGRKCIHAHAYRLFFRSTDFRATKL